MRYLQIQRSKQTLLGWMLPVAAGILLAIWGCKQDGGSCDEKHFLTGHDGSADPAMDWAYAGVLRNAAGQLSSERVQGASHLLAARSENPVFHRLGELVEQNQQMGLLLWERFEPWGAYGFMFLAPSYEAKAVTTVYIGDGRNTAKYNIGTPFENILRAADDAGMFSVHPSNIDYAMCTDGMTYFYTSMADGRLQQAMCYCPGSREETRGFCEVQGRVEQWQSIEMQSTGVDWDYRQSLGQAQGGKPTDPGYLTILRWRQQTSLFHNMVSIVSEKSDADFILCETCDVGGGYDFVLIIDEAGQDAPAVGYLGDARGIQRVLSTGRFDGIEGLVAATDVFSIPATMDSNDCISGSVYFFVYRSSTKVLQTVSCEKVSPGIAQARDGDDALLFQSMKQEMVRFIANDSHQIRPE